MKKLVTLALIIGVTFIALSANAEEKYVGGGFEASGHINTGFGYNYTGKNDGVNNSNGGTSGLARDGWSNIKAGHRNNDFGFLLDEVQLNLMKTFGENIKFRTDLAFGDANIGSANNGVILKQAYVTANIPAGNGIELLAGRFAAPFGYESINRNENNTITRSAMFNFGIRPRTMTGLKLYYAFSDAIDWHIYVVNNLMDGTLNGAFNVEDTIFPTFGTRLGYTWGEQAKQSTIGLSAIYGPQEGAVLVGAGTKLGHPSFLVDLDWNIWATDAFAIGGEGLYRTDYGTTGTPKAKFFGGIVDLHYVFSDVWDGTLKYSLLWQNNYGPAFGGNSIAVNGGILGTLYAPQTGAKAYFNEISLAGGYQITDGAKFVAEYRLDWTKYKNIGKSLGHAVIGQFEYAF